MQKNSKWNLSGDRNEEVNRIISECSKLTQQEYMCRRSWLGNMIHWELWKTLKFVILTQIRMYPRKWDPKNSSGFWNLAVILSEGEDAAFRPFLSCILYIYIFPYIYVCVRVRMCVWVCVNLVDLSTMGRSIFKRSRARLNSEFSFYICCLTKTKRPNLLYYLAIVFFLWEVQNT